MPQLASGYGTNALAVSYLNYFAVGDYVIWNDPASLHG